MAEKRVNRTGHAAKKSSEKYTHIPIFKGKSEKFKGEDFSLGVKSPDMVDFSELEKERKISEAYPAIDSDLAVDNLQNDIPDADLQDLN